METRLLKAALTVPLATAGLALAAASTQAASISGPGTFSIFGGVTVTGDAGADGTTGTEDDLFTFDFGDSTVGAATGGFSGYRGASVTVSDLTLPPEPVAPGGSTFPLENFVTLDDGDTFTLTSITPPEFTTVTTPGGSPTTRVDYAFDGIFTSESGNNLPGQGIITSQFTGTADFQIGQIVSGVPLETTYSASFEAVPEPLTIAGAAMAVGFGAAFRKKIKGQSKD
jgi:hypothetical protein